MSNVSCIGDVDVGTADGHFRARVCAHGDQRMVHAIGELDLSSYSLLAHACLDGIQDSVIVDLAELTFMDCGGYRGIAESRIGLERRGGSLLLTHQMGEPARLLLLIDQLSGR